MKRNILNLGKALNKAKQQTINGGITLPPYGSSCTDTNSYCEGNHQCPRGQGCYIQDTPVFQAVCKCLN